MFSICRNFRQRKRDVEIFPRIYGDCRIRCFQYPNCRHRHFCTWSETKIIQHWFPSGRFAWRWWDVCGGAGGSNWRRINWQPKQRHPIRDRSQWRRRRNHQLQRRFRLQKRPGRRNSGFWFIAHPSRHGYRHCRVVDSRRECEPGFCGDIRSSDFPKGKNMWILIFAKGEAVRKQRLIATQVRLTDKNT